MKKSLLSILSTLAAISMAANVTVTKQTAKVEYLPVDNEEAATFCLDPADMQQILPATPTADGKVTTLDFHYCYNPQTVLRPGNGTDVENSAAIKLPAEWLERYVGCKITGVKIASGFNGQTRENYVTDATIFISNDIFEGKPVYTQRGRLSKTAFAWNDITLKTPYQIPAGKDVYVGYTVIRPTEYDGVFPVDREPNMQKCSFWVNYEVDGERRWEDWSDMYGSVCMHLIIEGENLPNNDLTMTGLALPRMAGLNTDFEYTFRVTNHGVNTVDNFTIDCTVGNTKMDPISVTIPDGGLAYNESCTVSAKALAAEEGTEVPVTMTLSKVGGADDSYPADNTLGGTIFIIDPTQGFMRTMVFEEGTGTWCGWCPRGTAAIAYMNERYSDGSFIGYAIHNGDPMQVNPGGNAQIDYEHGFGDHMLKCPSYPNARYNRIDAYGNNIASIEAVQDAYKKMRELPAIADINFKLYFTDENKDELTVVGTTRFAINNQKDEYRVAYVLLEDNIGPFGQSNYYSGSSTPMGGWEKLPSAANVMFDHVARYITAYTGEKGTVPFPVTRGGEYKHKTVVPLANMMNKDLNKISVVGLVINQNSGEIENAAIVHGSDALELMTGINDVAAAATEGPAAWYTIQGIAVAEPTTPGIYVKVSGGKSEKVIIR